MPMPAEPAPKIAMRCSVRGGAGNVNRGEQGPHGHGRCPLDIVVEGAEPVAVAFKQSSCVDAGKILPLQQHMGTALDHGADEGFDEIVVFGISYPLVTPPHIERIFEALHIVGTDIEQYRQTLLWVNASARGIQRELADGDSHASGTLIAESENALAIADHDRTDCVVAGMPEDLANLMLVGVTEK